MRVLYLIDQTTQSLEAAMFLAIGSQNPVKLETVRQGVSEYWPDAQFEGVTTESGVSNQPLSEAETARGAYKRAVSALDLIPHANLGVGVEGGCLDSAEGMWAFAYVIIVDRTEKIGRGQTGRFLLPPGVADLIRAGKELGEADDIFFSRTNSKQKEGAIGLLSGGRITRVQLYKSAVMMALFPFVFGEYYSA